ncbi:MAG: protein translocase subunit SecF, partial [Candidatus Omnitrophica bacterium]|nr:protein translocase subunit SecF [Candidatus Omnitrophota bacterium]
VLISVGMLALTGREISLPVIAALLTVVGYSINDTIVLFDRIREDRKFMRRSSQEEIINASINQTLSRTVLTSVTTLLVVLALFFFGGKVINDFSFVLLVGVVFGTYSSIFIASPLLIDWPTRKLNVKR